MNISTRFVGSLAAVTLMFSAHLGCDSDSFGDAPSAQAPSASAPSADQRQQQQQQGEENGDLPPGHPPIGQVQQGGDNDMPPAKPPRQQEGGSQQGGQMEGMGGQEQLPAGKAGETGPLRWDVPERWTAVKPASSMRRAQYQIPGAEDAPAASLAVFHFGSQGGGSVQANIDRWVGQFEQPDGSNSADAATKQTRDINGLTVHTVDVAGTYDPGMSMGGGKAKENQRMLAAVVESPNGLFFFKLVGSKPTVSAAKGDFDSFVQSLKPAS